eukprot:jgi/Astpho2/3952/Aster-x0610
MPGISRPVHFQKTTPLIAAAQDGHLDELQLLLDAGVQDINQQTAVNVNLVTARGTALMTAARQGDCDMLRLLIHNGADLHTRDAGGTTAVTAAAMHRQHSAVQLLIQQGADPFERGEDSASACDVAQVAHPFERGKEGVSASNDVEESGSPRLLALMVQAEALQAAEQGLQQAAQHQHAALQHQAEPAAEELHASGGEEANWRIKVRQLQHETDALKLRFGSQARAGCKSAG